MITDVLVSNSSQCLSQLSLSCACLSLYTVKIKQHGCHKTQLQCQATTQRLCQTTAQHTSPTTTQHRCQTKVQQQHQTTAQHPFQMTFVSDMSVFQKKMASLQKDVVKTATASASWE